MGIAIKDCRHGRMMFYENDFYIGRSLAVYGEYSEGEVQLWEQFLKPGMTVLDVGANIGCHTVYFAKAVGPKGHVFAIEPHRQLYQMLAGNLALNELRNVHLLLGAAGEAAGSAEVPDIDFTAPVGNFGHVVIGDGKSLESVPLIMVDTLQLPAVHLIKIDVEGMEDKVVAGRARPSRSTSRSSMWKATTRLTLSSASSAWAIGYGGIRRACSTRLIFPALRKITSRG